MSKIPGSESKFWRKSYKTWKNLLSVRVFVLNQCFPSLFISAWLQDVQLNAKSDLPRQTPTPLPLTTIYGSNGRNLNKGEK